MLLTVDNLPNDLRAVYRKSLRGEMLPAISDSRVGLAILQLAANKSPADTELSPDESIQVSSKGTQKTLRELAVWYIARSQLRSSRNHYALLGLTRDASSEQVRDHYRRLIAMVHPDVKPEDFPDDAAAQVNLAYETLYDEARRKDYDGSIVEPMSTTTSYSREAARSAKRSDSPAAVSRFGWLRSRNMLVWGAGALFLSVTVLLLNLSSPPKHPEIVVAKPRSDGVSLRETQTLSQAEPRVTEATAQPSSPAAVAPPMNPSPPPAQATSSVALSPSPTLSLVASDQASSRSLPATTVNQLSSQNVRSVGARATVEATSDKPLEKVASPNSVAVVDEFLVLLSESIEAGQSERFARLFSAEVAGRNKILNDFTQVFEATKRREVRFVKVDRFRPVNGAPTFAGQIEISMTANDGSVSRQQMFVQGALNLQRGKPVLTRWSSHPI